MTSAIAVATQPVFARCPLISGHISLKGSPCPHVGVFNMTAARIFAGAESDREKHALRVSLVPKVGTIPGKVKYKVQFYI